eukprot:TRINITY_DN95174_c0_g1_i1.p1 TRINITY_DN95174_c0_g1~~TRINITY_DN95174_c0_g1_i1.p1  ORF type:complete len:196 (-),score=46.04 TRINITY_DN95174_c0_g1_i1:244-786(-)
MMRKRLDTQIMTLKQDKEAKAAGKKTDSAATQRVRKDLEDLERAPDNRIRGTNSCLRIPDEEDLLHLEVTVTPVEGFYKGASFDFQLIISPNYPHEPPKAVCKTKLWHPNIDTDGAVCLNILRADYRPVLTLKHIIFGLELLFIEPNPDDPLNREAARMLRDNRAQFAETVKRWMRGQYF